jgi:hypothetical protein
MNLEGKYHVFGPIGMKALIFTPDLGVNEVSAVFAVRYMPNSLD